LWLNAKSEPCPNIFDAQAMQLMLSSTSDTLVLRRLLSNKTLPRKVWCTYTGSTSLADARSLDTKDAAQMGTHQCIFNQGRDSKWTMKLYQRRVALRVRLEGSKLERFRSGFLGFQF
jgi:hypothetical protein